MYLYENSSRFQYIFKYIFKMLSIFFKVLSVGRIVPNCKGHCCIQLGAWGCCKSPVGSGESPGGGHGGEGH